MFGTKRNLPVTCTDKSHPLMCRDCHTKTVEVQHYWFMIKALHWGEWSTPHPNRFILGKKPLYWLCRMLCGLQYRSGGVWRKISLTLPGFETRALGESLSLPLLVMYWGHQMGHIFDSHWVWRTYYFLAFQKGMLPNFVRSHCLIDNC
jgi:hypothetical protein